MKYLPQGPIKVVLWKKIGIWRVRDSRKWPFLGVSDELIPHFYLEIGIEMLPCVR